MAATDHDPANHDLSVHDHSGHVGHDPTPADLKDLVAINVEFLRRLDL